MGAFVLLDVDREDKAVSPEHLSGCKDWLWQKQPNRPCVSSPGNHNIGGSIHCDNWNPFREAMCVMMMM